MAYTTGDGQSSRGAGDVFDNLGPDAVPMKVRREAGTGAITAN
jgi:hypothetical protein